MSVQWGDAAVVGTDKSGERSGNGLLRWKPTGRRHRLKSRAYATLIAGAPDFYTRDDRITDAIQKNIRYFIVERGIGGLQANHAADIFRNRYGDCKDKTTLLIAMLRVAGIDAFYVPVDDSRGLSIPATLNLWRPHDYGYRMPPDVNDPRLMAIVKAHDGNAISFLILPTSALLSVICVDLQGSYGTLAAGPRARLSNCRSCRPTPMAPRAKETFALAADGTLTGQVETTHCGPEGADCACSSSTPMKRNGANRWRPPSRTMSPEWCSIRFNSFSQLELDKPLEVEYKLTAAQYAHQAGALLLVRPRVVGSHVLPFNDKPRTVPIDLSATGRWRDSFDITLPKGYVVDETPDPVNVDLDFASYHSTITAKGDDLHYEREYVVRQVELPAERAADFRKLESAILRDEKGTAVLKKQ